MIGRILDIPIAEHNAFLLFGPRKTGKTSYLRQRFPRALTLNLLDTSLKQRLLLNPQILKERCVAEQPELVIVDEVQKVPELLDVVHDCLESLPVKFILCGSSARKLKHGAANLLGGRAWHYEMYPLVTAEIPPAELNLNRILNHGTIPQHYLSSRPEKFLESYIADYINEEIQAEALIRNVPAFSRFLHALAFSHGELINFANLGRDCGVSPKTVAVYFEILVDTLLGFRLSAWRKSRDRKLIATDKFYLYEPGVTRALKGMMMVQEKTVEFGRAFEHFLITEVRAFLGYREKRKALSYWRTSNGLEIDLIVGDAEMAVEFKATETVKASHVHALRIFAAEHDVKHSIIVCLEPHPRDMDGILLLPWRDFCARLWRGELV